MARPLRALLLATRLLGDTERASATETPVARPGGTWALAAVYDTVARLPLVWRLFTRAPTAQDLAQLLRRAVRTCGRARHLITDRGAQFTAKTFQRAVRQLKIRQRFGADGRVGSIALLERFWRTVKAIARVQTRPALRTQTLERRLTRAIAWYAAHTALGTATPREVYRGTPTVVPLPAPPRARPGEGPRETPFVVAHVDSDHALPVLLRRAA